VEVAVVDAEGLPAPQAEIEGSGDRGGRVLGETDAAGIARGSFLPPGMYRVFASHPTLGRGNRIFELAPGESTRIEITLLRSPPR
jgi:hypothetical protein